MTRKPFPQCFWVHDGLLCAGCYPGDQDPAMRDAKLGGLLDCGIRRVVSLMDTTETGHGGRCFEPYVPRLRELAAERKVVVECLRLPIRDGSSPAPPALKEVLDTIDSALREESPTYLRCWGGHGRTSTVIACHLIQKGRSPHEAIDTVVRLRADLPKNHYPFEGDQERFVRSWSGGQT
jgi:protein-tyrosine phosphatase